MNDIAFDDYKTISAEYYPEKPEMTFTPSYSILHTPYSILLENYSFGLGLSNFSPYVLTTQSALDRIP